MLYLPDQLDALRSNLAAAEADLAEVSADLREMTAQRDKLREAAEDVLDEHDRKQTRPLYS
jgi:septal ring factor EnvC (AmiA/AmiB activator)